MKTLRSVLASIGLLEPSRSLKRQMHASGLLPWRPLVPEEAFSSSIRNGLRTLQEMGHDFGDYVEFGVSRGTSMACSAAEIRKAGLRMRLIGFDSFEGLGDEAEDNGWSKGAFASTEAATRRYLKSNQVDMADVELVKGWFCDTATLATRQRLGIEKASLLMIDCDTYEASKDALDFASALLKDDMVVVFDDWGWSEKMNKRGQKEAFGEFLSANRSITSQPLPAYSDDARLFLLHRSAGSAG